MQQIILGFEVGSGAPIGIPPKHLAVTGQTQESGKTTALEALISRSGLRAVSFVTKRGEGSFHGGRRIAPYFRERADWQFVEAVLESAMLQKMRFERAWIIRASKGAKTLADVQANVRRLMVDAKGLSGDVYLLLNEYLEIVVPLIRRLPAVHDIAIGPGVNVMDLAAYPSQMQALVIRSVLEWIYEREKNVIAIIPEAWEFLPQGRGSPVKLVIRKGAALGNYVWLDSQDIAGVEKEVLKQVSVWLIGVQREANELKRALAHIPAGIRRPKLEDVAQLDRGHFFVCWKDRIHKVYVWPEWMSEEEGVAVATGKLSMRGRPAKQEKEKQVTQAEADALRRENEQLKAELAELRAQIDERANGAAAPAPADSAAIAAGGLSWDEIRRRIMTDPVLLRVLAIKPELQVEIQRHVIEASGSTLRGRLACLIAEGFFDEPRAGQAAYTELERRGLSPGKPNVYREADKLAELGFLTKEEDGYKAVPGMKVSIVEKE